tara:strand:- start:5827 stop:6339 length:513 start_codon:yes stop_codon:yes gene_type:complete
MKKDINLLYFINGKDTLFKTVNIFDADFKKDFYSFLKCSNYFNKIKNDVWESLVLSGNDLYYCCSHDYFYHKKYNLEYHSDIFTCTGDIPNTGYLININIEHGTGYNNIHRHLHFYDFNNRKINKEILITICIQLEYKLYQVFLNKKDQQGIPCIPGITRTTKLLYSPPR